MASRDCSSAAETLNNNGLSELSEGLDLLRGQDSRTACPLVPPAPNVLIAALRTISWVFGQGIIDVGIVTLVKSIFGFGFLKCICAGMAPLSRHSVTFTSEASAEHASRWPMLLLTEPTPRALRGVTAVSKTEVIAENSIGSPAAVPVPCQTVQFRLL